MKTLLTAMDTDLTLLKRYVDTGCEASFSQLVDKYAGMVFAVALQRTGNRESAEEVAQNVFLALARKASQLRQDASLGAWLHRTATLESAAMRRAETRRNQRHEKLATMKEIDSEEDGFHEEALPLLDEAVQKLKSTDRDLLLRRFVEGMSFGEISHHYGIPEATGRKRMSRILKKLSAFMGKQGVAVSVVALATTMTAHWSKAAPTGLAQSLSHTALAGAATTSNVTFVTAMMTTKMTAATMIVLGAAFPLSVQWAHSKRDTSTSLTMTQRSAGSIESSAAAQAAESLQVAGFDLAALARELRRLPRPNGAFERELELELLMHSLTEAQAQQVAALLRDAPNAQALGRITMAVFSRWAEFDPHAAATEAARLGELSYIARNGALTSWARQEPEAAFAFMEESILSLGGSAEKLMSVQFVENLIRVTGDRNRAIERMDSLADTDLGTAMIDGVLKSWSRTDPDEAFAWVQAKEDYGTRNRYTRELLLRMGLSNPSKAFDYAMTLEQPRLRTESVRQILGQWGSQGPEKAHAACMAYVNLPESMRDEGFTRGLADSIAQTSDLAFEVAEQLPAGANRDLFHHLGIRKLSVHAPEEAAALASQIPDTASRADVLESVGKSWLETDRVQASAWLRRESGLASETINHLLKGE